jgi:hypothetical protein
MKAEVKQKWLEALRSGEYAQGQRYLRREGDKFCCLGVLCDLVDPNGWVSPGPTSRWAHSIDFTSLLPLSIARSAGLEYDTKLDDLMSMNDRGKPFVEIADWIEANIPAESDSTGASES